MLIDEIKAACTPELIASGNHEEIAALVSVGRTKIVHTLGGIGAVMEALGPIDGAALLDGLEAQAASIPALKWAFTLINRGDLDFGSASTRAMITMLIDEPARTALLNVAQVPNPITEFDVRCALYAEDGTFLG